MRPVQPLEPCLRAAARRLGGPAGRLEAEVLLAHVLGVSRGALLGRAGLSEDAALRFEALVADRVATGRPVAYLTGRAPFRDLVLQVDERVLVPRPETETLIDVFEGLEAEGRVPPGPVADLGTGSGALALVLCRTRTVLATDLHPGALAVAAANRAVRREQPGAGAERVGLCRMDGLAAVRPRSLAAVVTNPPYVRADEWPGLPRDVGEHEPLTALVPPGPSVEAFQARLVGEACSALLPRGWWLAEVGAGQAADMARCLRAAGLEHVRCVPDLAGVERVVAGQRPA